MCSPLGHVSMPVVMARVLRRHKKADLANWLKPLILIGKYANKAKFNALYGVGSTGQFTDQSLQMPKRVASIG